MHAVLGHAHVVGGGRPVQLRDVDAAVAVSDGRRGGRRVVHGHRHAREVRVLPAASRATAVSVWVPFESVVVFERDRVRARGVGRADVGAVHPELHALHADVVGGVGGDRDRARAGRVRRRGA